MLYGLSDVLPVAARSRITRCDLILILLLGDLERWTRSTTSPGSRWGRARRADSLVIVDRGFGGCRALHYPAAESDCSAVQSVHVQHQVREVSRVGERLWFGVRSFR